MTMSAHAAATSGLAEALAGKIRWQDALAATGIPQLDLLPSGRIPEHPAELLGHRAFVDFLAEARGSYAHVIIDAPPVLGVSDALVLLPNVDGVLFVVRYGVTHSLGANHSILKLKDSGTPCIGPLACFQNAQVTKSTRFSAVSPPR